MITGQARIVFTPERPQPGEQIHLSNADNTGVMAWRWCLRAPVGVELADRPATMSKASFLPTIAGVYEVELEVNAGRTDRQRAQISIEVGDLTLADRLRIRADYIELSLEANRADEGSQAYRQTEAHIALLREAAAELRPKPQPGRLATLASALAELGDKACGLVVSHRGWTIDLLLPTEGDAGWVAFGQPDARDEHDDPLQVDAMGDTVQEALDACADACDEAESL